MKCPGTLLSGSTTEKLVADGVRKENRFVLGVVGRETRVVSPPPPFFFLVGRGLRLGRTLVSV